MLSRIPLILALAAGAALGDELYRQDHANCAVVPNHCCGGLASQDARNPGGPGWMYESADNFDAAGPWTITNLEFWGTQSTTAPATTLGFMIRVYNDNSGNPGTLFLTQDVFSFTEEVYYTLTPTFPLTGNHYTLNLGTPVTLPSAGRYWLAIVGIQNYGGPNDRQWFWGPSNTVRGPTARQDPDPPSQNYGPETYDLSFVLFGNAGSTCYANCDGSTGTPALTANDFQCFINKFAASDSYANCDGSTGNPALTANDFQCFINKYAGGCS